MWTYIFYQSAPVTSLKTLVTLITILTNILHLELSNDGMFISTVVVTLSTVEVKSHV